MNKTFLVSMLVLALAIGATVAILLHRSSHKETLASPVLKAPVPESKPAVAVKEIPPAPGQTPDVALNEPKQPSPPIETLPPPLPVEPPPQQSLPPAPPQPKVSKPAAPAPDQNQPVRPRRNQTPPPAPDAPAAQPVIPNDTAREALGYVGADPAAEAVWYEAINDPNTSKKAREDLIEDLNEEGFADPKNITVDDLPLIMNRLSLIEQLAPDSMDETNYAAFMEAYKDLTNMFNKLVK